MSTTLYTGEMYRRGMDFISRNMHRPQSMLRVGGMGLQYGHAALGDPQRITFHYGLWAMVTGR